MAAPIDLALETCGMGLNTQSAYVFKAAYDIAAKKSSSDFGLTMSRSVDTQEASVLKQLGDKSPDSTKVIIGEIQSMRNCVIAQSAALRQPSRLELLEQCRVNVQDRISPPGQGHFGTLRAWSQLTDDPEYRYDTPVMAGYYDTGGVSSFVVREKCDIRGGRLQDVVDLKPRDTKQ
jgi:hypothetical protein